MIYPPDIQHRLATMTELSPQEQFHLHCDIVAFVKAETATYGRLRPDTYPDLYPPPLEHRKRVYRFPLNRIARWLETQLTRATKGRLRRLQGKADVHVVRSS